MRYHREDMLLKELNLTFINDFEYFLREEKKCCTNTVWGYKRPFNGEAVPVTGKFH